MNGSAPREDAPPRVAVVIPYFNDGPLVDDALASLRDQEPHELVVVDNASSEPASLAVLDRLRAVGVRVVREEQPGVAAARTRGLRETTAPYLFPLDSDDRVEPGALARLADALDADPAVGAAWGDLQAFGAVEFVTPTYPVLDPFLLAFVNRLAVSALYRRTALEELGGWTLDVGYEDWDVWLGLAERGWHGVNVGGVTMHYRIHGESRQHATHKSRHTRVVSELRRRHPGIYRGLRGNAPASVAPRPLRLTLRAVARLPRIDDERRSRLSDLALRTFMPQMRLVVDGHPEPSPFDRFRHRITGHR